MTNVERAKSGVDPALVQKVAEVGAALCCYAPGAGNPDAWPTSRCDCKFGGSGRGEQTGCAEARRIYWMLTEPDRNTPWWLRGDEPLLRGGVRKAPDNIRDTLPEVDSL